MPEPFGPTTTQRSDRRTSQSTSCRTGAPSRVSETARAYGAALFEFGPIDEAKAASKLGVSEDAVIAAADELADALSQLFE